MKSTDPKKRGWLWAVCAGAYTAILALLTLAERDAPDASIQTMADAFWYSLVTMSTVGYGDLYPVTGPGKLLGVVFILFSFGLMAFLISCLIRIVTGRMLPSIQLWAVRNKAWYIFSCQNSAAFTLAADLAQQDPGCVLLFPPCADRTPPEQLPYLIYHESLEILAARKKDRCHICFMDEQDPYAQAVAALPCGHPVYCRTSFAPDVCPPNLTVFDPYDCCARRYWQDHGLKPEEQTVLLIGDGKYAEHLLTQGLLMNVYGDSRRITYHVFGSWENYLRNHHHLAAALCPDNSQTFSDQLLFHRAAWNENAGLLTAAHRIILCQDIPDSNVDILGQIHRYFPVTGEIHLLCSHDLPGYTVFGTQDTIFTVPLVFREQLNRTARALHSLYCSSAGGNAPGWEQLSEFLRQSNVAAASHLLTKIRILLEDDTIHAVTADNCLAAYDRYRSCSPKQKEVFRQIEHERWMRFHSVYNWRYAPVRNNAAREHPLMLPYEDLSPAEQKKDDLAWELLETVAVWLNK